MTALLVLMLFDLFLILAAAVLVVSAAVVLGGVIQIVVSLVSDWFRGRP